MVNYYILLWTTAIGAALLLYCKSIFKDFHWPFALALSYTILQTFGFSQWVQIQTPYSMPFNMVLKIHHCEALIVIFLCVFLLKTVRVNLKWFSYICAFNIILTLCLSPFHFKGFHLIGLAINPAMNAAITSICLPFVFLLPNVWIMPLLTLGGILIVSTKNFTPVLALVVGFFGPAFFQSEKKIRNFSIVFMLLAVLFFFIHKKGNVIDRVENWVFFGRYWKDNFNLFLGAGNASFSTWGPELQRQGFLSYDNFHHWWYQKMAEFTGNKYWFQGYTTAHWYWLWLHSDVYQTLWELGVIGLVLWANCIVRVLYRVRKNEPVLASMLAWLTVAVFYYPLHFPIHLGLGLGLISVAIKKES